MKTSWPLGRHVAPFYSGIYSSERLTGALLDRLTHHVHILELNGDSYRLASSRKAAKSGRSNSDLAAGDTINSDSKGGETPDG